MGARKTNNTAQRNRGKMVKVCPNCEGNMIATKLTGYGSHGMFWRCNGTKNTDGCDNLVSVNKGKTLENKILTGK